MFHSLGMNQLRFEPLDQFKSITKTGLKKKKEKKKKRRMTRIIGGECTVQH